MPLSELLRMASGKLESGSSKPNTSPTDLSTIPESDFVELVWENGQISQSSRLKRNHNINDFPGQNPRTRDKYIGNGTSSRVGKVGLVESLFNDTSPAVRSGEMDFSQDDDMATWLNYPMDDNLQQDYCPQILPEVSGITMHEPSNQRSSGSIQTIGNLPNGPRLEISSGSNLSSSKTSLLSSWSSLPVQTSLQSLRSGVSDFPSYNKSKNGDAQPSSRDYLTMKLPKQNVAMPCSGSGTSNFSFLSRQTAHSRAGLNSAAATSSSSAMEKIEQKEKSHVAIEKFPVVSPFLPSSSSRNEKEPCLGSSKFDTGPSTGQPCEESHPAEPSDHGKSDASVHRVVGSSSNKGVCDGEKTIEPVVASSSVCSGSSADRGSSDQTQNLKRKGRDNEESEYRSEDVEEESVGVKKAAGGRGGTGSKRSRAAEVHNLSERRRRDRINEKMRALQELIPNCNKADKASMLDEAIEYLKTLQLQVQMMSMGAGMCIPQMMFPAGMQHLHAAHMPHFSPMGMGYGMSMLDMTRGSPSCPIYPLPSMPRPHFASPSVSGPTNFHSLAGPGSGSHLPVYGHPSQGHPMSIPRAPVAPLPGRPPMNAVASRMGFHGDVPYPSPPLNSKDPTMDKNTQLKISSSMNESSQVHTTNEKIDQLSEKGNQVADDKENAEAKSSKGNGVASS